VTYGLTSDPQLRQTTLSSGVLSGASFRGSAAQPPKTEPGKENSRFALAPLASLAGVACLKSTRASDDAAW
jgi:hypothetical protein